MRRICDPMRLCALRLRPQGKASRGLLVGWNGQSIKGEHQARSDLEHVLQMQPQRRWKSSKASDGLSSLVVPVAVKVTSNPDDINVGEELTGNKIAKENLLRVLSDFCRRGPVKKASEENGLDPKLFNQAFVSFRKFCLETLVLPPELHIVLSDILQDQGHVDDLFPFFLKHSRQVFPHLECLEELKKISDLRSPVNWYPEARSLQRKIILHSGPTNSGKTYQALQRFISAESGVYCGPLKLLAVEVHAKTNDAGTPCDLVTGEERKYANAEQTAANHVACTVEMASTTNPCEVAVIDEIQMLRDPLRGWAWTRALLGIPAKEIHICGEEAALDIVREMLMPIGEEVEVHRYKRLTPLQVEDKSLASLEHVKPGDCIVCFSKNDIYSVSLYLEKRGQQVAVIYGGLPPGTKLAQAKKFNDPEDACKLLVATDAIGMGLNLSIRRVIFYSITKPNVNEKGEKEVDLLPTSQALQIAGRAGRFNTQFDQGYVTTYRREDLPVLRDIMSQSVDPINAAGIHPTAEQIELFAYHLPDATLSNLIDIFVSLCQLDTTSYFMCNVEDFKFLADMIQHVPLPLRARYVFCCSPINKKVPFVCTMFLKFSRQYSQNEPVTLDWLCRNIGWPFKMPTSLTELVHLEAVFDVLDLYLWLSYRFQDLFPDQELVRDMQRELDHTIHMGVAQITKLIKASTTVGSYAAYKVAHFEVAGVNNNAGQWREATEKPRGRRKPPVASLASGNEVSEWSKKPVSGGPLTEQLIASGLLTPKMLEQLHQEWDGDKKDVPRKGSKKRK